MVEGKDELLYQTLDNQIMAVPYCVEGDSFRREAPRLWTERRILRRPTVRSMDLHPDGERVAAAVATEGRAEDSQDKVVFIFNFFDELRRLVPGSPSLSPGVHLGAYEITAPIGAGGMGEVYRARDTRLNRDVAIKVLPETFASDPERIARFQREAKTLASLNHPHIGAIYGLEESTAQSPGP